MGRVKGDHIERLITLTSDNIKRLSLYFKSGFLSSHFEGHKRTSMMVQIRKYLKPTLLYNFKEVILVGIQENQFSSSLYFYFFCDDGPMEN